MVLGRMCRHSTRALRETAAFGGGHPVEFARDQRGAAGRAGVDDPVGEPEGDVDPVRAHSHDEHEGDDQHVEGEGEHDVYDPHDDRVEPPAEVAADRADEHAEAEREQHGEHADLQVGAAAVQKAGPDVAAELVGAEPVGALGPDEGVRAVLRRRAVAADEGASSTRATIVAVMIAPAMKVGL